MSDEPRDAELAAYLADELDDVAARAFERRLRDDAELASRLERVRRLDAVLASMPAPEVALDTDDLWQAVQQELDRNPVDELAATRSRRRSRVPAWIGGAAAAAVLAVVGVVGVQVVSGGGDDSGDDAAESVEAESAEGGASAGTFDSGADTADDGAADAAVAAGPLLLDSGRELDADDVPALAAEAPPLDAVLEAPLLGPPAAFERPGSLAGPDSATDGGDVAEDAGSEPADETAEEFEEGDRGEEQAEDDRGAQRFAAQQAEGRAVIEDAYGDDGPAVLECLGSVAEDDVLLLADRVVVEGEPALLAVFDEVTDGAATGRRLTWVLDLDGCDVLRYVPGG